LRAWIFDRDGHRCVDCRTTDRLTLDHIWPAVAGGREWASNLVTRCASCNSRRHAVWEREHGTYSYPSRHQLIERWKS
jgi:5-methylcytosine-specific restriction endonuclease McrA